MSGSDCKTVRPKKIHKLLRVCKKTSARKSDDSMLPSFFFIDRVYRETAAMSEPTDVFAADIYYHSYCCKAYFNKYNVDIEDVSKKL